MKREMIGNSAHCLCRPRRMSITSRRTGKFTQGIDENDASIVSTSWLLWNNVAVNIEWRYRHIRETNLISFGYIFRSGIIGLRCHSIQQFLFFETSYCFHCSSINLYSWYPKIHFSTHFWLHWASFHLFIYLFLPLYVFFRKVYIQILWPF